ncbi:MAG TPA: hypothetical protein PLG57_01185 [Bacteroidia bacterium]|jgi:hypothetical protein|nr:hypothetical protein [Bacteroidia bacterium]HQF27269.1 hypothetical protein [Bacteroidia bacterium]HQK96599.1 hypothetical protein [Bacteroidia bacterium]
MNQREIIIQSINHQIETFTEQFLMAAENGGPIPLIEIDLMKHTVRNLYQQLHELQIVSQRPMEPETLHIQQPLAVKQKITEKQAPIIISEPEPEVHFEEPQIPEVIIMNDIMPEPEIEETVTAISETIVVEEKPVVIETEIEEPVIAAQPVIETKKEIQPEVILSSPSEKAEIIAAAVVETPRVVEEAKKVVVNASLFDDVTPTVASKYKEQETLYDKISKNQQGATIAEKLSAKPVIDLRKSIGINERFAFINELFEGNQQLFMESIDKLNNMPVYDDARRVLYEELAGKMNWNTKAKTFSDLDELVKRRFSAS